MDTEAIKFDWVLDRSDDCDVLDAWVAKIPLFGEYTFVPFWTTVTFVDINGNYESICFDRVGTFPDARVEAKLREHWESKDPGVIWLTEEQSRQRFDERCREELGISGEEFAKQLDAGTVEDTSVNMRLAMLRPR